MTEMMKMKKKKMAMSPSSSSSSCLFSSLFNEDIIIDKILLKLSVRSLLRLRCVSRYFHSLITNPSFIKKHLHHNSAQLNQNFLLISSRFLTRLFPLQEKYRHCAFNFMSNATDDPSSPEVVEFHCPFEPTGIQASCNGLLFLQKFTTDNTPDHHGGGYIWNPCTREYKKLPPPPPSTTIHQRRQPQSFEGMGIQVCSKYFSGFCGFGYDCTNDEYKIMYYENRVDLPLGVSISEFKLYRLGTNTWTRVSDDNNRYRYFTFGFYQKIGVFVNGALHWIMSSSQLLIGGNSAKIISFDMEKEEFREIQKPPRSTVANSYGGLQVLQGCLCLCEFPSNLNTTTYIWMLKDYAVKDSWTKLFTVVVSMDKLVMMHFKLLRLCENGEIVMARNHQTEIIENGEIVKKIRHYNDMIVYDPVNHISRRVENLDKAIKRCWTYEVIYTESLVSLNSGTFT